MGSLGIGIILFIVNIGAMKEPNVALTWVAIALIVLGIWSASRARAWKDPGSTSPGVESRLAELDQLRAAGTITEDEHQAARKKALEG